jgi:UDP-N-acetylglucosamine transferase subunit ALG13
MIFLTVGTLFPFDRLVRAVDEIAGEGLIKDRIFAQIGPSDYSPANIEYVDALNKSDFDRYIGEANTLISHAGLGSITMALNNQKPLLVMPRLGRFGEHVNDHQLHTADKFEELGHILVAHDANELPGKINDLNSFVPQERQTQVEAVVDRIASFFDQLKAS